MARHLHGNNEMFLAAKTIEDLLELLSWPLMLAHIKPLMLEHFGFVCGLISMAVLAFRLQKGYVHHSQGLEICGSVRAPGTSQLQPLCLPQQLRPLC